MIKGVVVVVGGLFPNFYSSKRVFSIQMSVETLIWPVKGSSPQLTRHFNGGVVGH